MELWDNESSSSSFSYNNGTVDEDHGLRMTFKRTSDVITVGVLLLIMTSVGADILFHQIISHLRCPIGIGVGMVCQFVAMPLVGFTVINSMSLRAEYAIGVLLISCCPGGAVSNAFSYYVDGDVPLSVTMTCLSTLLALVFMPFNLWIYGTWINLGQMVIPYKTMATSLAYVTSPACIGMLIRWRCPKIATYLTKVGNVLGFLLIIVAITLQNLAYPSILVHAEGKLVVAVLVMPLIGMVIGYFSSWAFKREVAVRKTVAIESGVQNAAIALAVIALSDFQFEVQGLMMLFPMMYGMSMITLCLIICLCYQLFIKVFTKKFQMKKTDIEKQSGTNAAEAKLEMK